MFVKRKSIQLTTISCLFHHVDFIVVQKSRKGVEQGDVFFRPFRSIGKGLGPDMYVDPIH